jgi:hypothetical protein
MDFHAARPSAPRETEAPMPPEKPRTDGARGPALAGPLAARPTTATPARAQAPVTEAVTAPPEAARPVRSNAASAQSSLAEGKKEQSAMIDFIRGRLSDMDRQQAREIAAVAPRPQRDWIFDAADNHKAEKGSTTPDPQRWHRPARMYEEAARAAARGDLPRAAGLLRSAVEAERQVIRETSTVLQPSDVSARRADIENPWRGGVTAHPTASIAWPQDVDDLVSRVTGDRDAASDLYVREVMRERAAAEVTPVEDEEADRDRPKTPHRPLGGDRARRPRRG